MEIKKVVIIGSGTMGSGIAAHLCNANIPVTLLDLKTEISEKAREKIHKSRPPLLIDKSKINNINVGNINDDFFCGIKIDKQNIKFLQDLDKEYDILFISPLRLKLLFEEKKILNQSIFDYFSSIEILKLDQQI